MVSTKNITTAYSTYCRRFLIKATSLLLLLFIASCDNEEVIKEEIVNSLDIKIDNEYLKLVNSRMGSNESCESLFFSCSYQNNQNPGFRIEFSLNKNGALKNITLFDYRNRNTHLESADFNPKGLMTISNFTYDETKKYLHFDFKGHLLKQSYFEELDTDKERKYIEGSVTSNNVRTTECTSTIPKLNFVTTDFNFFSTIYFGEYDSKLVNNPFQLYFYSDNGFRAIIKSKIKLPNLAIGTYKFDQNTIENRIDFDQYVGVFRATQLLYVRDIDWKKYQTAGSYTILEHTTINGYPATIGEMNLQVYDNGVLLYNIKNGKFVLSDF
jgi:hypothetical protein